MKCGKGRETPNVTRLLRPVSTLIRMNKNGLKANNNKVVAKFSGYLFAKRPGARLSKVSDDGL